MNPHNMKARWRRAQALQILKMNYPAALDLWLVGLLSCERLNIHFKENIMLCVCLLLASSPGHVKASFIPLRSLGTKLELPKLCSLSEIKPKPASEAISPAFPVVIAYS